MKFLRFWNGKESLPGNGSSLFDIAVFSFFLGLMLLPFDTLPYFRSIFREIGGVASFYPFSLGLIVSTLWFLIGKGKLRLPYGELSLKLAVIFFLWVGISLAVNSGEIAIVVFKGRSGAVKGVLQFVMLAYCLFVSVYTFNIFSSVKTDSPWVERFILLSFLIPAVFSVLEILYLYKVNAGDWLNYLRPLISDDTRLYERLRSVGGEPTSFAFYCAFLAPWLMKKIVIERPWWAGLYAILFSYFMFLVVLTLSKAAYIMVFSGLAIFLALTFLRQISRLRVLLGGALVFFCFYGFNIIAPTVTVYTGAVVEKPVSALLSAATDLHSPVGGVSTRVRISAQIATFKVANANPIFGVGFAQAGFHMYKYLPKWEQACPGEVQNWSDGTPGTPWPPSHGLHARVAAETGYVGLALWLAMWISMGIALLKKTIKRSGGQALLGAVLCAGAFSCILMGFNTDSFKFLEYWVSLGFGWAYLYEAA